MRMFKKYRLVVMVVAACLSGVSVAQDYQIGSIKVANPWSRPTPPNASMGVVYMALENTGVSADTLISVHCDCAKSAEMHRTETDASGKSSMRQQAQVDIAAQGVTQFAPGGLHVMLIGLTSALEEGSRFPITLEFAKAGQLTVDVKVQNKPSDSTKGERAPAHDDHDAHKHH